MDSLFAPVFMHNIMPVSSANATHGTMGSGATIGLGQVTVAAGATLPRRRGPFSPGQSSACYLPTQPPPGTSAMISNSNLASRPLPAAGAFDPNIGRSIAPPSASSLPIPVVPPQKTNIDGGGSQEIGI